MKFRLKAFSLHLLGSASALTLILGSLYIGWYRWPGWYLADATQVVAVLIGVDLVLGPLMTLIIASTNKSRRELTRDIGIIVAVQICALIYGATSLWSGRPLYYAYSESVIQLVQAYEISAREAELGRKQNPTAGATLVQPAALDLRAVANGSGRGPKIVSAAHHRRR